MGENVEKIVDHVGGRSFQFLVTPAEYAAEGEGIKPPVRRRQIFGIQ